MRYPMILRSHALLANMDNKLMSEELTYDKKILRSDHVSLYVRLTSEQTNIYNLIVDVVNQQHGSVFFVNGFGGFGKTFIWNTLTSTLRSCGDIVLAVASSGIASQLIPGGRTAHSRFAIPLDCNENSICNIIQASDLTNLLIHTKLIIWDKAPMTPRYCFEALDKPLSDICGKDNSDCQRQPFGGKVIVFDGDFRQILRIIPRGSRQDIVLSSLNSSYILDSCKVLTLTKNMRIGTRGNETKNLTISEFAE
ncbi:ATP-dependent DNA helicase PIF1-like [Senna tora]|uniref:ATP-dependent DNA helicase n=1 Tax=Senna tora TaxID=362788 RepID=A0A834SEF8_9FABA|nr:ATP-dependent DNA helicase PIF1-like [Senna tora]